MSEKIVVAFIAAGISLFTTILTLNGNAYIKYYETKRANLNNTYLKLLSIVNSYPNVSPNDVLKGLASPLRYSMESFDSIITNLRRQIEDYSNKLENEGINLEQKREYEEEISNIEYDIKQIEQIRDDYFDARNKYREFCKNDKMIFDLYAGQEVKNTLVEFEVNINNIFKSGRSVGDVYNSKKNIIDRTRDKMTTAMRNDIGI
ncbi:MAG: hypothetical protein PHH04_03170 [Thomasclavelia sp.]|jgi:hypothetical protein|nr:hypothetical protein [Thomasclavelia sp.]